MVNSLELFSGAGGLAKGLELAGARHCAFVEWNSEACKTLRENYDPQLVHEVDVRKLAFSQFHDIDIIAGGPPCQPFSLGGKAKGSDDERDMWPYAIAAIHELKPKAFIFENVKGLLRKSFEDYFNYIILRLTYPDVTFEKDDWKSNLAALQEIRATGKHKPSYEVTFRLVNAADYGVPQKRERVIIVGIRKDLDVAWQFPQPTNSEDALDWEKFVTMEYWNKHHIEPTSLALAEMPLKRERLLKKYGMFHPTLQPWRTVRDAIGDLSAPHVPSSPNDEHAFRQGAREYDGHTGSDIDSPSKTIKAGAHGVPGGENMVKFPDGTVRYYTVLEAKRIQTFPDDYPIAGAWSEAMRQLGNAVPVRLGKVVASSLIKAIS